MEVTAEEGWGPQFERLWRPFAKTSPPGGTAIRLEVRNGPGDRLILLKDGGELPTDGTLREVFNRALVEINRAAVLGLDQLAIHAGVVGRGRVVVAFPSPSGAGKSTLTAACLRAGFDYWSDEALILSPRGEVIPYPKPLSLSTDSRRLLGIEASPGKGEMAMTAEELGAQHGPGEGALRHVVVLERRHGAPEITSRPSGETVTALLGHAFNHYRKPEESYRLACWVAERAQAWRLSYEEPVGAARLLWQRLVALPM